MEPGINNELYDERLGVGMAAQIEAMYASALDKLERRLAGLDPFPVQQISFLNRDHVTKSAVWERITPVVYLRDAFTLTDDKQVRFSANQQYSASPDYLLQSSNYIIAIAGRVAVAFGGDLEDPADPLRAIHGRQLELVAELKAGKLI